MSESLPVGVYWGSFDPITKAHESIIQRVGAKLGKLIVIVNNDPRKNYQATIVHRINMIHLAMDGVVDILDIKTQHRQGEYDYFVLKKQVHGPLVAITGSDSLEFWLQHQQETELDLYDEIWVADRHSFAVELRLKHKGLRFLDQSASLGALSSSQARVFCHENNLEGMQQALSPKIIDYIVAKRLYT